MMKQNFFQESSDGFKPNLTLGVWRRPAPPRTFQPAKTAKRFGKLDFYISANIPHKVDSLWKKDNDAISKLKGTAVKDQHRNDTQLINLSFKNRFTVYRLRFLK